MTLRRRGWIVPALALLALFGSTAANVDVRAEDKPAAEAKPQELNVAPAGFVALFNGKDLSGWIGRGHVDPMAVLKQSREEREKQIAKDLEDVAKHWSVDNGELVNDGHGVYLTTAKDYGDFELLLDYKTVAKADSGIYLRGTPQVQIWDTTEEGGKWDRGAQHGSGGLFNNQKTSRDALVHADKPFGEWNHFRILMVGEYVSVWLNDKLVVDDTPLENFFNREQPVYPVGPIQLQTHGGEIRFRNVFLREIPRKPPESGYLVKDEPAGDDWFPYEFGRGTSQTEPLADFELHATVSPLAAKTEPGLQFRAPDGTGPLYEMALSTHEKVPPGSIVRGLKDLSVVSQPDPAVVEKAYKKDAPNHYYLRAKGAHLQAWLNGIQVADVLDPTGPASGAIRVGIRNSDEAAPVGPIFVRDLRNVPDSGLSPQHPRFPAGPIDEEGFVSVFNGKDLTGWVGAIEGHKVEGGKIVAPAKGGGNLYIDKKYSDFVFRFEFRLFEGGNNGVGIRAEQGKDAAYFGMELQILDNPHPSYLGIKPYQAHGSVYGVQPAKRGYQKPLGEWNTEEIIAHGSRIAVTLNGKVITDCDIEKVARDAEGKQKTIDGGNHPGLFNKDGYIGFLGHGHRIEFRNLRIKELK